MRSSRACEEAPTLLVKSGWTAPLPHVWTKEDLAEVNQDNEGLEDDNEELEDDNDELADDTHAMVLGEHD